VEHIAPRWPKADNRGQTQRRWSDEKPSDPNRGERASALGPGSGGWRISFTPTKFAVLSLLYVREGSVVSRDDLLDEVRGEDWEGSSNVVEAVVKSIRRKLDGCAHRIHPVHSLGDMYRE
jgi:DNA-binding response OmpR family regulator